MEEILSSIKRIIAEDTSAPAPRPAARDEEHDVLELTDAVEPKPFEHEPVFVSDVPEDAHEPEDEPVKLAPLPAASQRESEALLSAASADASRRSLAALSRMVVKSEEPAADNTLEGLVRELLRPMLKDWLDANLPGIVQATVDREIARISGRTL